MNRSKPRPRAGPIGLVHYRLLARAVLPGLMLHFLAPAAHAQADGPTWRVSATAAPFYVWHDELNDSQFGFELRLEAQRYRVLPVPLRVGGRFVQRYTPGRLVQLPIGEGGRLVPWHRPGQWIQEWAGFVGIETHILGLPQRIDIGYFTVERHFCPGCREDPDRGFDLSIGAPSILETRIGRFIGVLSSLHRITFGDGFGFYTTVDFGLSLQR